MAITENTKGARILVAGCGNLGGMIARRLSQSHTVFGLRRNAAAVPETVIPVAADLLDAEALAKAVPRALDAVIYCLTPSSYDEAGYENAYVNGLINLLAATDGSTLRQLVYISSTSVYHQNDDNWVDETSATEPPRFSGQCVLAGEQLALASGFPSTVVRFSGIYGPSRRRFLEAVANGEMAPSKPAPYSNRIHEHDAARVVTHLVEKALAGERIEPCYLASDNEPARLDEVVAWVRSQIPSEPLKADARTGGRAGSKRCSNRRLRDSGFVFDYPDYRAGYGEMISQGVGERQ